MSDEQLAAFHETASRAFVVSTEDDDVAEAILLLILQNRVDEIVTVMTTEEFEYTFTVAACCDDPYGRTVRGWVCPTAAGNDSAVGMVEIPLTEVVGVHIW